MFAIALYIPKELPFSLLGVICCHYLLAESTTDHNIHIAPLPENAEKTVSIAVSDGTAGAGSSLSEPSLIGMHNNNSHEDGGETLADHERRKRGAGSSAEGSEGSGMNKAKVV